MGTRSLFLCALVWLAGLSHAQAATRTVCASGCDHTTITAALAVSTETDVVRISAGTYSESLSIPLGVRVEAATAGTVTLTHPSATLITFAGPNAEVAGLVLAPAAGARAFSTSFAVTIEDVTMSGRSFTIDGAILSMTGGATVTIRRSTFTNVSTTGGSLIRATAGLLSLDTVQFVRAGAGSVLNVDGSAGLEMTAVDVGCSGTGRGVRFSSTSGFSLTGGSFTNCVTTGDGGGAYVALLGVGNLVADGTRFENNRASDGGGLYFAGVAGRFTRIANASFIGNNATTSVPIGGGARITAGNVELLQPTFTRNTTDGAGSALAISGGATQVTILRGSFCDNIDASAGSGSAVRIDQGTLTVRATLFGGNDGFAIEGQTGVTSINVDHSVFLHNEGGIFRRTSLTLTNSVLAFNAPYLSVSGLMSSGTTTIENDLFFMNGGDPAGLSATNVTGRDPGYFSVDAAMPCISDLRVRTTSPLIDAGSGPNDTNATTADIGLHGGSDAAATWWVDADSDGSPYVYDCAPMNLAVRPGRTELCNGIDDDCDLSADEGLGLGLSCSVGVGSCSRSGTNVCGGGGAVVCSATAGAPSTELCGSGADEDCDANTDEGFGAVGGSCTAGVGSCLRTGTIACSIDRLSTTCGAVAGPSSTELCGSGLDEDCDGNTDEGFPSLGSSCAVGVGTCRRTGALVCSTDRLSTACSATPGAPATELCGSAADEDCDGTTDEGFPNLGMVCSAGVGACLVSGVLTCSSDRLSTRCDAVPTAPGTETCGGGDENCNGMSDEGALCVGAAEGTSCLGAGTLAARCGCSTNGHCASGRICDTTSGTCVTPDAGMPDAGMPDAGMPDAGLDGGIADAGGFDGGALDGGVVEPDGGDLDGGDLDGGDLDASIDAGIAPMDAAVPIDAFSADASGDVLDRDAENDAASPDAGGVVIEGGCACRAHASSGRTSLLSLAFGLVLCLRLGRRRARFGGRR
jgi:hypothetical protein